MLRGIILLAAAVAFCTAHTVNEDSESPRRRRATCPSGMTAPSASSSTANFNSFHLHIGYSAANALEVSAVSKFLTYLYSVAGASSTCTSTSDTATGFCYSQTITSYVASAKQDPFFNMDVFIFVGTAYLATAMQFAQRYHGADMVGTDLTWLMHPNSDCPGLDHLQASYFGGQRQFPLNTCPFWFQSTCGFRRSSHSAAALALGEAEAEVQAAGAAVDEPNRRRATTTSNCYSTTSCTPSSGQPSWNVIIYIVYNSLSSSETSAATSFNSFLSTYIQTITGSAAASVDCSGYQAGATLSTIGICASATTTDSKGWFGYPYVGKGVFVPYSYVAKMVPFFMRYRQSDLIGTTLNWRVIPITGCPWYAWTKWTAWGVNNTVSINTYPLLNTQTVYSTASVPASVTGDVTVVGTSCTSCTNSVCPQFTLYAPYLLNNLLMYSSSPKTWSVFTAAFESSANSKTSGFYSGATTASTYNDATAVLNTAFRKYTITNSGSQLSSVLKYALIYKSRYAVDTTYSLYDQDLVIAPSTGCSDQNILRYSWHTGIVEPAVNDYALNVADYNGRRRNATAGPIDAEGLAAVRESHSRRRTSTSSQFSSCKSLYTSDTRNAWLLYVTYLNNNPTQVTAVGSFASSFATQFGVTNPGTSATYTPSSTTPSSYTSIQILGYQTPNSDSIYNNALVISVPDANLGTVMVYASGLATPVGSQTVENNLGLFLVPNFAYTSACPLSVINSEFYLMNGPRKFTLASSAPSCSTTSRSMDDGSGAATGLPPGLPATTNVNANGATGSSLVASLVAALVVATALLFQ